jgi:hypothetical protein
MSSDISQFTQPSSNDKKSSNDSLYESNLNLNDLIIICQCIEAGLHRNKINVDEMQNCGTLYNRVMGYIKYIDISNKKEDDREESEKELLPNLVSKLELNDLFMFMSYLELMEKRELLNDDEKETVNNLKSKIEISIDKIKKVIN